LLLARSRLIATFFRPPDTLLVSLRG